MTPDRIHDAFALGAGHPIRIGDLGTRFTGATLTTVFWCGPTTTWLYRDDSRLAFKNRAAPLQPPPPGRLQRLWEGAWATRQDGPGDVRPVVAAGAGGFYAGVDLRDGLAGDMQLLPEPTATLEAAQHAASSLAHLAAHPEDAPRRLGEQLRAQ